MDKNKLRTEMLEKRRSLTSKFMDDASQRIYEKVTGLKEVETAKTILVYSNFDNEVKTGSLTGWLLFNGAKVCLPAVKDDEMFAVDIKSAALELSAFGVPQPRLQDAETINPEEFDLVIVPGVCFDRQKNRIGFGKGYYDKFLKEAKNAKRIALSYSFQMTAKIDADAHDVQMDMIVTEEEIIK